MKILITGGGGFIGSHLVERLILEGHKVNVLDDFSTGRIGNLRNVRESSSLTLINGSVLDLKLIHTAVKSVDYVFHLAAAVGVFNIVQNTLSSLVTNVTGTENVLKAAHENEKPFFLTSSSEVYGKNTANTLRETDDRILGSPSVLRWSYSEAKAIDESLTFAYFAEKGLQARIVRFFNTVGPRQVGSYGMVVPRFISSALRDEPITIYGSGNQTRCFAHIYDVIDAVIQVAFSELTIGKVINIGNDFEISMNDLARKIIAETNSKSEIIHIPYEKAYGEGFEDMERRVPNIELINQLVGWKPQRDLSTIIADISAEMNTRR